MNRIANISYALRRAREAHRVGDLYIARAMTACAQRNAEALEREGSARKVARLRKAVTR